MPLTKVQERNNCAIDGPLFVTGKAETPSAAADGGRRSYVERLAARRLMRL